MQEATATKDLQHYTKTYGIQTTGIYSCCLYAIGLGIELHIMVAVDCFLPRVGLRTYQHHCNAFNLRDVDKVASRWRTLVSAVMNFRVP